MRKLTKKLMGAVLAAAVALTALPVTASAAVSYSKKQVVYLTPGVSDGWNTLYVYGLKKGQTIKKSSIKSSKKSVLEVSYVQNGTSTYKNYSYTAKKNKTTSFTDRYAYISYHMKKAGTATISYKIGTKTYKTKVTLKKYTNPLKSITISGVSGGKNIASKVNKSTNASLKMTKSSSNGSVKISTKSGWKITYASVDVYKHTDKVDSLLFSRGYYSYSKPASSVTLKVGSMSKSNRYYVNISCQSTSGGYLYISYAINA